MTSGGRTGNQDSREAPQKSVPGLPWWLSGKESSCQCWRHRFDPQSGKIPPAVEQLSPGATTTEPVLHNKRSHCNKPEHCSWRVAPLPATREKPSQQQRPSRAKHLKRRSVPRSQAHPSSDPWAHSWSPHGHATLTPPDSLPLAVTHLQALGIRSAVFFRVFVL